ncbi:MAG: amino acid permease [Legionellales bacterium]|nr:amino acid permease [Legionellales bacterium]
MTNNKPKKILSVFSLVMINVIAVDSLRTLPINAEYGTGIIFFYLLASVIFFIPTALVAAELATGWPDTGGIYIWVREAFGKKAAFFTIWLQWIYNIVWYPTILSFIAATIAYVVNPHLSDNSSYLMMSVLVIFWFATFLNCLGLRSASIVSTLGALFGTLFPMLFMIILGIIWIITKHPLAIHFHEKDLIPDIHAFNNLAFFTGVIFGLIGMEMSAIHAGDVKNPQRDYPRALLYSTLIIVGTLIFSSLALAIVVPKNQISLVSGLIHAFAVFFTTFHLPWMLPVIALLITLGAFSGVSAWILGPTRGLYVACHENQLPTWLRKTNRHHAPVNLLILQGIIFTFLCFAFILIPSVNGSFWLLTAMTAQLALIGYILMFAACLYLRYKKPEIPRSFIIPCGKIGLWLCGLLGILTCLGAILFGFFPPPGINVGNLWHYELLLCGGTVILCLPPWFISSKKEP